MKTYIIPLRDAELLRDIKIPDASRVHLDLFRDELLLKVNWPNRKKSSEREDVTMNQEELAKSVVQELRKTADSRYEIERAEIRVREDEVSRRYDAYMEGVYDTMRAIRKALQEASERKDVEDYAEASSAGNVAKTSTSAILN